MKASLTKIVWHDWPALFATCALALVWLLQVAFPYLRSGRTAPVEVALSLTLVAGCALGWRIVRVQRLFSTGGTADGVVEALRLAGDRGRLEYSYRIGENAYSGWCAVHRSKQVLALRVGQKVTVAFDRQRPERSVVADLFAAP